MRVTVWPAAQQAAASASRDVRARLPVCGVRLRGRDAPFARMRAGGGRNTRTGSMTGERTPTKHSMRVMWPGLFKLMVAPASLFFCSHLSEKLPADTPCWLRAGTFDRSMEMESKTVHHGATTKTNSERARAQCGTTRPVVLWSLWEAIIRAAPPKTRRNAATSPDGA